jgi:heme exporter protein C
MRTSPALFMVIAAVSLFLTIPIGLLYAPIAANNLAPLTFRIFYFHVPAAWVGYLAFLITFIGSVQYLRTRKAGWDRLAFSAAEVGTLFTTIGLFTGLAWSHVEFINYRPLEDPKLIATMVLWLSYIAYILLRRGMEDDDRRARSVAVFGIIAFVTVPISFFAARVGGLHPVDITADNPVITADVGPFLAVNSVLFTIFFAYLLQKRLRLEGIRDEIKEMTIAHGAR